MVRPSALAVLRLMSSSTFRGLFDRKVGRLLSLENPAGVATAPVRARAAEQALQACRAIESELPPTASIALSATRVTVRPASVGLVEFRSIALN